MQGSLLGIEGKGCCLVGKSKCLKPAISRPGLGELTAGNSGEGFFKGVKLLASFSFLSKRVKIFINKGGDFVMVMKFSRSVFQQLKSSVISCLKQFKKEGRVCRGEGNESGKFFRAIGTVS